MEITKKYSKLHRELQLQEYLIPFKNLDDIDNKKEFVDYVEYFQIDRNYLLEQILNYKYLEFLHEKYRIDIIKLLEMNDSRINDSILDYINQYIDIYELNFGIPFMIDRVLECKYLKYFHKKIQIDMQEYLAHKYFSIGRARLNDKNLEYISRLIDIIELNASGNSNITTVKPFANTLKILYAGGHNCGINDDGLKYAYYLEELYAWDNSNITTIKPFSKTLKILRASGDCGINNNGLEGTNLKELYSDMNPKITKKLNN